MITFEPMALHHQILFNDYVSALPFENSEMTFLDFFIWRKSWGIQVSEQSGCLHLFGNMRGDTPCLWPILVGAKGNLITALQAAIQDTKERSISFEMRGVPNWYRQAMNDALPGQFLFEEDIDFWDYVYDAQKMRTLSGKKMHSKKNHVNRFHADHPNALYRALQKEDESACMALYDIWLEDRFDKEMMIAERECIQEIFSAYDALDIQGGVIEIDGVLQAFTVGEKVRDTAIIHIEKANPNIAGIYAVINQEFVKHAFLDVRWINREEDMGIEGLRRAKESYKPEKRVVKYIARLQE